MSVAARDLFAPAVEPVRAITFFAPGLPQTKGSAKGFGFIRKHGPRAGKIGVNITNDNAKAKGWAASVRRDAVEAMEGRTMIDGAVRVLVTFHLPRPKCHFNKRGLKVGAPAFPIVKERNDIDKLARCALDALTGVVWADDSQVVRLVADKKFGTPGATFTISEAVE